METVSVFVQIEDPNERVVIVRDAPSVKAVRELLPAELRDRKHPGAHATEVGEYLSYWNDDHCYYARDEERCSTIEEVAAKRDPFFKDVRFVDVEGTVL
jgi:hypothetical protein